MTYIPRLAEELVEKSLNNRKILILIGARQVGKTTLLSRLLNKYGGKIFNLDIEIDKARLLVAKNLPPHDAIRSLGDPRILVIDEAQRVSEISRIVKGWFDANISAKIILSGSSTLNLLDQSVEALTGRNEKIFLPPLILEEVVQIQSWFPSLSASLNTTESSSVLKDQLDSLMMGNLVYGSYPEAFTTTDKEGYLLNLTADYLLKDVFQLGNIKNPDFVKKLLLLLAYQIGSEVSGLELASNLGVSRETVEKYIDLLERTFVIFRIGAYNTNLRKEIVKKKKIYFWDTGVRNAILKEFNLSYFRSDIGHLWENWVIAEFAKRNVLFGTRADLYFWRSRDGGEVDLVVKHKGEIEAFEMKWSDSKAYRSRAFSTRYKVTPKIITKGNFFHFLLNQ